MALLLTLAVAPGLSLNGGPLRGGRWKATDWKATAARISRGRCKAGHHHHRPRSAAIAKAAPRTDADATGDNDIMPAPYEALYDQEALVGRGCYELAMMPPPTLLEAPPAASEAGGAGGSRAKADSAAGFGAGKKATKRQRRRRSAATAAASATAAVAAATAASPSVCAQVLRRDGVVRLNGALSAAAAAELRAEVIRIRDAAYVAVDGGEHPLLHFADGRFPQHQLQAQP